MNNADFNSPEYRRSRAAYMVQCGLEHMIYLLVTDAFLAKVLKEMGLSDATIGIISSLLSFAFLIQLISILMMQHMRNVKRTVILTDGLSMLLYLSVYLLPFLNTGKTLKTVLAFVCVAGGSFARYISLNIYFRWANSYVNPEKRGNYQAVKEMTSLAGGIISCLIVGAVMDKFEAAGNIKGSFIFVAAVIFVYAVISFVMLLLIKDSDAKDTAAQNKPLKEVVHLTLGAKSFRSILVLQGLMDILVYLTVGFLGTYKTGELLFTVGTVQLINNAGAFARMIFSIPLGRYSDKHSFAKGYTLGLFLLLAGFICLIFTAPKTRLLMIGYVIFYNVAQAGISGNSYNMMYSYVPKDCFVQAQAVKSSISGLLGFFASLLGSLILKNVQARGNSIFGITIYGQQVLAILSTAVLIITIVYTKKVVLKQKVMKQ